MEIINKSLLCEVLGIDERLCRIDKLVDNTLFFYTFHNVGEYQNYINIYELVHECKKLAYKQGYLIGLNSRQGVTLIDRNTNMVLRYISIDNLEQLVKFELNLCEWVLDNKDKDE